MYVLHVDTRGDNGVSIVSLDICFGTQLADPCGENGVMYA